MNTTEFLGFVTMADGYSGKLVEVALCVLPDGAVIGVMPFGFFRTQY